MFPVSLFFADADWPVPLLFADEDWPLAPVSPPSFSYCALLCLSILGKMESLDVEGAVQFIVRCKNFDGGFGCTPGERDDDRPGRLDVPLAKRAPTLCVESHACQTSTPALVPALLPTLSPAGNESHAGQVFTCIGALSLAGALHLVDQDLFCWWLCERQTKSGGLNGRPEKLQDVSPKEVEPVFSEAGLASLRLGLLLSGMDLLDAVPACRSLSLSSCASVCTHGQRTTHLLPFALVLPAGLLLLVVHVLLGHPRPAALDRPGRPLPLHPQLPG